MCLISQYSDLILESIHNVLVCKVRKRIVLLNAFNRLEYEMTVKGNDIVMHVKMNARL